MSNYEVFKDGGLVKAWVKGVPVEEGAKKQISNIAGLPFIHKHVAIMPDVHWGMGATVGSVIPTHKAIIPAAVGVDIGCGMMAVKTTLNASDLPANLRQMRSKIERAIPHGRTDGGGSRDKGSWGNVPDAPGKAWNNLRRKYDEITDKHKSLRRGKTAEQLGTLGGGNHFIEVCLDESGSVWFMLHSGSRGVGNRIGRTFIDLAKRDMEKWFIQLPDKDLSYLVEGTDHFNDYVQAVDWAQDFARMNRKLMMEAMIGAVAQCKGIPRFKTNLEAVNCHHNYVQKENHFGKNVWLTRKGAVCAREGVMGIIPGSMGAKSYIVRGLGNPDSFHSCSHGAGRVMSRTEAKKTFTLADHEKATEGVECKKDASVLDETPGAYKDIDSVMEAQKDLVEIVYTLRQVLCVKG